MKVRYRRIIFPFAAVAVALLLASTLSPVLSPVLIAMLLAVILNPLVDASTRLGLPRVVTVSILYVVILLVAGLTATGLSRQFGSLRLALLGEPFHGDFDNDALIELSSASGEPDEFTDENHNGRWDGGAIMQAKALIERQLTAMSTGPLADLADEVGTSLLDLVDKVAVPATGVIASGLQKLRDWAGGLVQLITLLVLIPFYLFFFLVEYPRMVHRLREMVPPRYREQVVRIARDIGKEQVAFLRGRLACGIVKAVFLWLGMVVLHIDYALPIALVTGLLSLVPFLGFLAGCIPASVIALTMPGGGSDTFMLVVLLFLAGEAFEGVVLFPWLLGKETGLHPVMIVVVLLAGGTLMGTLGVLVAVPLALACKILWREIGLPFYRDWAYPEPDEAGEGEGPREAPAENSSRELAGGA